MTRHTLTILEEQRAALARSVLRDRCEYAAILLCGRASLRDPWSGEPEERIIVRELIEIPEEAFSERTPIGMTWSTTPFYNALKRAEPKNFALVVVHSHPDGPLEFSPRDDVAEHELFGIAFDRLDSERPHVSMIMDGNGKLTARTYGPALKPAPVEMIRIIGKRWAFNAGTATTLRVAPEFDRQVRLFGPQSTDALTRLRVGIVGCGGTGSAVAALLARVGVGRIALFDDDYVDETNLNRLHFSRRYDANLHRLKVDAVGEGIARIGLSTSIVRVPYPVDDERSRNALKACDVIFGCTDDHLGRNVLNRIAHFYFIPVIDLGLLIEPNDEEEYDTFDGRVTVVQPGSPCQICRGLIQPDMMQAEALRRHDPMLYEHRRRAGYVPDLSNPSPVVVTFTTELATMAINELFQRLNGYRGDMGSVAERVRRFDQVKDSDTLPGGRSKQGCKLCQERRYDGRGDMSPFLDISP